jgi:hypothetical protein
VLDDLCIFYIVDFIFRGDARILFQLKSKKGTACKGANSDKNTSKKQSIIIKEVVFYAK